MILADRIIADVKEREVFGREKYGKSLDYANDTRDWLKEAYEEQLDALFYLKAAICKRDKQRRWCRNEKKKAVAARYEQTAKGRATEARYNKSAARKATLKRYRLKPRTKEERLWYQRTYRKKRKINSAIL